MQRVRFDRRITVMLIVAIVSAAILVFLDQLTKRVFQDLYFEKGETAVIDGFFFFSYTLNSGSAYGFLSDKSWGQTIFMIITPIALVAFSVALFFAAKRNNKTLFIGLILVISGTVGNFIDRVANKAVIDFIVIRIGGVNIFGVFNLADVLMTFGIILLLIHLVFLEDGGLFRRKSGKNDEKTDGD